MHNNNNIIEIENLTFARGDKIIFDGINLNIEQGKLTAIMGPSGTGKTTLLKLMAGLLTPDSGVIRFAGQDVNKFSKKELYQLRSRMGMLFQSGALFNDLNVFENVAFPLREHTNLKEELIEKLVLLKLHAVGLRGAAKLMPEHLSGGMKRRAALARTIALDPEVIFYDEPFTGQDPISLGVLAKLAKNINDSLQCTSVLVSHDVAETLAIADNIYLLSGGQVVASGTPFELQHNTSDIVSQFLYGKPDGPLSFHYEAKPYKDALLGGNNAGKN